VWSVAGNKDFQQFTLTDEHRALQEAVRALAADKIAPRAAAIDETGEFPWDVYEALRASGFHAIHIPEEYGGEGGDALAACLVIEEVARVCTSSSLIPAVNKLGTMPLLLSADEALLKTYLPRVASGEAMISYALSEREAGSDAAAMKTRAVEKDDGWVLNGQKSWITNAGISQYYTVMAANDTEKGARGGITAFVVHADDEGFSLGTPERKLGIHGSPTREILFDNCWIPGDRIVGEVGTGFQTAMRTLDHTRVTIGAQAIGIAQGALDVASSYVKERQQFGRPIAEFQVIQHKIAHMATDIEAARQLTYYAAQKKDSGQRSDLEAGMAKLFAADMVEKVSSDALQIFGGYGYAMEYPAHRFWRDGRIFKIFEGTSEIQAEVVAKRLIPERK